MMETTKYGQRYYVGKRQQTPDRRGLENRDNHKEEFERHMNGDIINPVVKHE